MTYVPTVGDIVGDGSSDDDDELDRTVVEDGSVCHKKETHNIISIHVMSQDAMQQLPGYVLLNVVPSNVLNTQCVIPMKMLWFATNDLRTTVKIQLHCSWRACNECTGIYVHIFNKLSLDWANTFTPCNANTIFKNNCRSSHEYAYCTTHYCDKSTQAIIINYV